MRWPTKRQYQFVRSLVISLNNVLPEPYVINNEITHTHTYIHAYSFDLKERKYLFTDKNKCLSKKDRTLNNFFLKTPLFCIKEIYPNCLF